MPRNLAGALTGADALDLVIRGGTVVDGTGAPAIVADVGVKDGRIVAVGEIPQSGREEIDAAGRLVTPGFVDIHTHYDGQATWEARMSPSSAHGVTTVLTGNCGVGFAPCRPQDRECLVELMEGVEDIPELVMTTGVPWKWQTFPDYLDYLEARHFDVDIATQLPHACLRVYVMGERAVRREAASQTDLEEMTRLTREAMIAGALGVGTSRSINHRFPNGDEVPTKNAAEVELAAIAEGMREAKHGVLQALFDFEELEGEFAMFRRVAETAGLPASFTLAQTPKNPHVWKRALALLEEANQAGVEMRGQVIGRPTGVLMGHNLSLNPFSLYPTYQEIAALPLTQKLAQLREPDVRARILADKPGEPTHPLQLATLRFEHMYPLGDPPNYAPAPGSDVASRAQAKGVSPQEIAYELLLEQDGEAVLFSTGANYVDHNLDVALELLQHQYTMLGLGDGGAHYSMICDAGYPTFMLTFWARDRADAGALSLPQVIRALSHETAVAVGLCDRGIVAPGYKADLNIIDYEGLRLHAPRVVFDLPAGGRRLTQAATGYVATIVDGVVTYRDGVATGALPGRLIRGPQEAALA